MFQRAVIAILQIIFIILLIMNFFIANNLLIFSTLTIVSLISFLLGMQNDAPVFEKGRMRIVKKSIFEKISNFNASVCSAMLAIIYLNSFVILKIQSMEKIIIPSIFVDLVIITALISVLCLVADYFSKSD